jgi:diguanylate cyclase (GGDEF)-like protein
LCVADHGEKREAQVNTKNLRILLAEGGHGEAAESLRALFPEDQKHLELTIVPTISTLLCAIRAANPEMIFLDLALTRPEPLEAVRCVHRAAPEVPLIVFADAADKDRAAQCLREGALDYLLKGYMDPQTLDRVLRVALEQNTQEGLMDLLRDPLTGLYIREGFLSLGAHATETANRMRSTLILLCVRIGNLEAMREEFGKQVVESGLRSAASVLKSCFRPTDVVARTGESQFAALAVDAIEPSGPVLRQRVEKRFAALHRDRATEGPLELRISMGFWSTEETKRFSEFLDSVEAGLRESPLISEEHLY